MRDNEHIGVPNLSVLIERGEFAVGAIFRLERTEEGVLVVRRLAHYERGRKTAEELRAAGYRYAGDKNCSSCGKPMQFWSTPKSTEAKEVLAPYELDRDGLLVSHFATCPNADRYRSGKR